MKNEKGKVSHKNKIRTNCIINLLLDERNLSLADIARRTGLTLPMVSNLVDDLKRKKIVNTSNGSNRKKVGKPPIIADLNHEAGYVIGIDFGHTSTNFVVLDLHQNIVDSLSVPIQALGNNKEVIDWLVQQINELQMTNKISKTKLLGIGLSIPGIVHGREGFSKSYLNFGTTSIREILEERLKKPVYVEHDAKAMSYAEYWFGSAKNSSVALCLNIGWGLGLGILVDGKVYHGTNGCAGEFGHVQILRDGLLCHCGKIGCLETVASGMAIGREARDKIKNGSESKLLELCNNKIDDIDAALVVRGANEGDVFSINILDEAGKYLGEGIASLINLFNPDLIILGGRVAGAGNFILNPVRANAIKNSHNQLYPVVEFVLSTLGPKAGALGVSALALRYLFDVEKLNPSAFV